MHDSRVQPRRRRVARALAVSGPLVLMAAACNWTSYGYDLNNSRTAPETKITVANASTLVPKWRIDGLKGVTSTPATANGLVYFGSWDGKLHAVNAKTGATSWETQLTTGGGFGPMIDDSPAIANGVVYVGDGQGKLHAVDALTGVQRWVVTLDAHPNARIFSSPVLVDGHLLIGVGSYELVFEKATYTFRGSVVSIDPATGAEQWRIYTTENDGVTSGAGASVWSTAAVDTTRHLAYIGVGQSYTEPAGPLTDSLLAIDYQTGTISWHRQFTADDVYRVFKKPVNGPDSDLGAAPNLFTINGQDVVGVGDKSGVYAVLDRVTGATVWARQLTAGSHLGGVMLTAAVSNGTIYVSSNSMPDPIDYAHPSGTSTTFALDAVTGAIKWQTAVPQASFGALTLANGVLYQPTIPGTFYAFNATTGAIITTLTPQAGAQLGGGVTVDDGLVFAPYGFWFFLAETDQVGGIVAYGLP